MTSGPTDRSPSATPSEKNSDDRELTASGEQPPKRSFGVRVSVPWIVEKAETGQDAINISVAEVGKALSGDLGDVHRTSISVQNIHCGGCGMDVESLLLVAGRALVGLELELTVEADSKTAAERAVLRSIGPRLAETPLSVVDVVSL